MMPQAVVQMLNTHTLWIALSHSNELECILAAGSKDSTKGLLNIFLYGMRQKQKWSFQTPYQLELLEI